MNNSTDNNSTNSSQIEGMRYPWMVEDGMEQGHLAIMCVSIVLSFGTLCTNGLLITAVLKFKQLHTPGNILIANLSFTDVVRALILATIVQLTNYEYNVAHDIVVGVVDKEYLCCIRIFTAFLTFTSLAFYMLISAECFIAVTFPFWHERYVNNTKAILISVLVCCYHHRTSHRMGFLGIPRRCADQNIGLLKGGIKEQLSTQCSC